LKKKTGKNTKPAVLAFFDRGNASYIASDLRLLEGACIIRRNSFLARRPIQLPAAYMRQFWQCLRDVSSCDTVFVHFAGWNSLLPLAVARIFNKPSVLFLHGTDSVDLPSIGYGNFRKQPLATVTCCSLRLARKIVAVDGSLLSSENTYAGEASNAQGVMNHCPGLRTPAGVLAHGFDPHLWPSGELTRDVDVLTVAVDLGQEWRRRLKGVDLLIDVARCSPDLKFVVIGLPPGAVPDLPQNMVVHAEVPPTELVNWYQRSICYAQVSMSEGFGCALAEAMLCGCIPIVSNVGAMPRIIGDTGHVIRLRSRNELVEAIRRAKAYARTGGSFAARSRVVEEFTLEHRREGLFRLLRSTQMGH
jgi:glycosyltransferase involved in cell wall biosynthesis